MSNFCGKQRSSLPIKINELDWTGSGTLVTTNMASETFQVRVVSDVRGYGIEIPMSCMSPERIDSRNQVQSNMLPRFDLGEGICAGPGLETASARR